MLKSGDDFLKGLRDGRRVYVGGEQVEDIAAHPGFRGGAASLAALYDWKADPAQRGLLSFTEDGDDYSMWFLRPHRGPTPRHAPVSGPVPQAEAPQTRRLPPRPAERPRF